MKQIRTFSERNDFTFVRSDRFGFYDCLETHQIVSKADENLFVWTRAC